VYNGEQRPKGNCRAIADCAHNLKVTIMYMTAIRSTIKAIDVTQRRVLFNFSLIKKLTLDDTIYLLYTGYIMGVLALASDQRSSGLGSRYLLILKMF
jgi:hypothetical protein